MELKTDTRWKKRYTLLYILIILPGLLLLLLSGKTFFWGKDAYYQQYPVMRYTGMFIRNLFSGNASSIEWSLGEGLDVIGTLAYYGLTDPMQWVSALLPSGFAVELWYHALLFIYIWLSGLLFGCFIEKKLDIPAWAVTVSALAFAFSGYMTAGIIKNPYYANGPVYLMLLLIASERVFEGRSIQMMAWMTALMLISNFYLAYVTTLLTVIYILIRLTESVIRTRDLRTAFRTGIRLCAGYLLGMLISMVFFLPSVLSFLESSRTGDAARTVDSLLRYPLIYYIRLAALFCAPYDYAGYWSLASYSPLIVFALAVLFRPKKKLPDAGEAVRRRVIRASVCICAVCMLVPLCGKIFNGFGYVTNRWSYGFSAALCAALAWALPHLFDGSRESVKLPAAVGFIMAAISLAYAAAAPKLPALNNAAGSNIDFSFAGFSASQLCSAAACISLTAASVFLLWNGKRKTRGVPVRALTALTALCCFFYFIGYSVCASTQSVFYKQNLESRILNETSAAASQIGDDAFYRVDTDAQPDNQALIDGYNGISWYWSLIPSHVSSYYRNLETPSLQWSFRLDGVGGDPYIESLASVRYAVRRGEKSKADVLPYGAVQADTVTQPNGRNSDVYELQYTLPMGIVYHDTLSERAYKALNPIEKRQALLSCAVLDAAIDTQPVFEYSVPDWKITDIQKASLEDHAILSRTGGKIEFSFNAPEDSLIFLNLEGTSLELPEGTVDLSMNCVSGAGSQKLFLINPEGNFAYDQQGLCAYIGSSEDCADKFTLYISEPARIEFESLSIFAVPARSFRESIEHLQGERMTDVQINGDTVAGKVDVLSDGILQLSVPYSKGWKAFVDGKETETLRCGGMYTGIALESGSHDIRMAYTTPGLKPGAVLSAVGIMISLWSAVRQRVNRKQRFHHIP